MTQSKEFFLPLKLPENLLNPDTFKPELVDFEGFICKTAGQLAFAESIQGTGLHLQGWYNGHHPSAFGSDEDRKLPIVSFTYYKGGAAEPSQRLVVLDVEGFGVLLPSHKGQSLASYVIGLQIGIVDPRGIRYVYVEEEKELIARKAFSMDCMVGGDCGNNPVDASSHGV